MGKWPKGYSGRSAAAFILKLSRSSLTISSAASRVMIGFTAWRAPTRMSSICFAVSSILDSLVVDSFLGGCAEGFLFMGLPPLAWRLPTANLSLRQGLPPLHGVLFQASERRHVTLGRILDQPGPYSR